MVEMTNPGLIVPATTQKTQAEIISLEDAVLLPNQARSRHDIEVAIFEWDALYREYLEAGGHKLTDHMHVCVIMWMMPADLKKDILKKFDRFDGKPKEIRRWTRQRIQWLKLE